MATEPIQIDQKTVIRLRKYVSSENDGKTYGLIGKTAAKAINEYLNLIELRHHKNSAGNKLKSK